MRKAEILRDPFSWATYNFISNLDPVCGYVAYFRPQTFTLLRSDNKPLQIPSEDDIIYIRAYFCFLQFRESHEEAHKGCSESGIFVSRGHYQWTCFFGQSQGSQGAEGSQERMEDYQDGPGDILVVPCLLPAHHHC